MGSPWEYNIAEFSLSSRKVLRQALISMQCQLQLAARNF